jgi:hypothetical protein
MVRTDEPDDDDDGKFGVIMTQEYPEECVQTIFDLFSNVFSLHSHWQSNRRCCARINFMD